MNTYYWKTDESHSDNMITMLDFINNEMEDRFDVIMIDGTYAEIKDEEGNQYAVRSSGNGDFFNHKVEFELL